jgi:DnaK suppressor protein
VTLLVMVVATTPVPSLVRERLPQLRADLEAHRASLRREIADGERELAMPATPDDAGTAHGAAADLYDREVRMAELMGLTRNLYEIEAALGRMRGGTYGICVDCGRPIPIDRLIARPQAPRDVECQRHAERQVAL